MLRETVDRLDGVVAAENRFVITSASLVAACVAECPEIPARNVIGEPEGKNTAPPIGLMSGLLGARDPEAVLLVLPADHAIGNIVAFRASLAAAFRLAVERSAIVIFGIVPSRPETGYGYIEHGARLEGDVEAYPVARFQEKPDAATARTLWNDGRHTWNSGLFCSRATVFLAEYAQHLPLMRKSIDVAVRSWDDDPRGALERYYAAVEATSIDIGVMQRTDHAIVLPAASWGWDDVGSWDALARWIETSGDGNVEVGRTALADCRDVIAYAQTGRIAALGLERCVIVRTEEETLVVARDALADLRDFVRRLNDARPGGAS
jgi:mannose-1-phosphate guanylyltransferase/mannose-6-phosphate isomerase